jgi:molybdopterin synthase catalytic subunit
MIRVQREDFDVGAELDRLAAGNHRIGGVASFIGLVRDMGGSDRVSALTLEHYPGMTEKKLAEIETEAHRRWPLDAILIIHRYGRLEPGDRIVLVATASPHREAALAACHFLIDWLKTDAPFLEKRRDPQRRTLGRNPRRRRCREGALEGLARKFRSRADQRIWKSDGHSTIRRCTSAVTIRAQSSA